MHEGPARSSLLKPYAACRRKHDGELARRPKLAETCMLPNKETVVIANYERTARPNCRAA